MITETVAEIQTQYSLLTEIGAQIEKLIIALADAEKNLKMAKPIPTPAENRSRNPRSLYEDNNPIA